ncbi:phage head-tail connector protein [Paenibacillus sp. TAB 01]|uniref:phage head-tail connector protein n=1 Tax=Paenibacillus sp. TAB 01 TaxID=3368988 RepID=UPI0037514981
MTFAEYLIKLKSLLGIPQDTTEKDERLSFVLETVIQSVLTYCRITEIPEALDNVVLQIAEDYYRSKYSTEFEQTAPAVVSVKRGDVQTNFGSSKPVVSAGAGASFVRNYAAQLNAYRRMGW